MINALARNKTTINGVLILKEEDGLLGEGSLGFIYSGYYIHMN